MRFTIPNQLTILRIGLTPIFVIFFFKETPVDQFIASIIYIIASITDSYDGWYARRFGVVTRWGQFMDPLADKILVSSALIIFACLDYVKWWMVCVIVIRDFLVTIVRIFAIYKGTPIVTSTFAKWKTFTQMSVIFIILIFINWLNYYGIGSHSYHAEYLDFIGLSMIVVTMLTIISATLYFYENRRLIWRMVKEIFAFTSKFFQ